jgi:hypothetical protein
MQAKLNCVLKILRKVLYLLSHTTRVHQGYKLSTDSRQKCNKNEATNNTSCKIILIHKIIYVGLWVSQKNAIH